MQQQSIITLPCASTSARKYLDVPFRCSLVSYGKNVVACAEKVLHNELRQYLDGHKFYRCLTSPAVFELNEILASAGLKVGYMSEYFLPDVSKMQAFLPVDDKFELRRLGQADFASLYLPQWSNALCSERKELDILGMAAYDLNTLDKTTGEPKLIGLAACCCASLAFFSAILAFRSNPSISISTIKKTDTTSTVKPKKLSLINSFTVTFFRLLSYIYTALENFEADIVFIVLFRTCSRPHL